MPSEKLSVRTKLFYGVGDVGNAIFNTAVSFFLLVFYTDGALIVPALATSALLIGKIGIALPFLFLYPITRASHARVRERLAERGTS